MSPGNSSFEHSTHGNNNYHEDISVSNLKEGENLCHSLAIVRGRAPSSCSCIKVRCFSGSSKRPSQKTWAEWPVQSGAFRLLVELQRGQNRIELETAGHRKKLRLVYEPRRTTLRVTPVYVICSGHDGYFQVIYLNDMIMTFSYFFLQFYS